MKKLNSCALTIFFISITLLINFFTVCAMPSKSYRDMESDERAAKRCRVMSPNPASIPASVTTVDPELEAYGRAIFREKIENIRESMLSGENLYRAQIDLAFVSAEMSDFFLEHVNDVDDQGRTLLSIAQEKKLASFETIIARGVRKAARMVGSR